MHKVYKHQNIETGRIYIGITKQDDVETRWNGGMGYYKNKGFFNDILYYGWKNFTHEVLVDNIETEDEAIEIEKEYIEKYDSYYNGYNGNLGGKGLNTRERFAPTQKQLDFYDRNSRKVVCDDKTFKSIREFAKCYDISEFNANAMIIGRVCMPKRYYDLKLRYEYIDELDYDKYYKLSPNELKGVFPKELYNKPMTIKQLCENMGRKYHHTHHKEYLETFRKDYVILENNVAGYKIRKEYTVLGEINEKSI